MTAPTAPTPVAAALPRPPWRTLALLTLAVAIAHLLLLALAPAGLGPEPLPLANRFITRTIVIAPPAPSPTPATESAPPPKAVAAAPIRPARPRMIRPPIPKQNVAPALALPSETAINSIANELPALVSEPAAEAPMAAASAASGAGTGTGSGSANRTVAGAGGGSTPGATRALRVPGSVRLSFAVTAQQGPQPLSGAFGELIWLQDGSQYNARLSMTMLFKTLRQWTSTGTVGADGIEPERYSDTRRREVASHFVRERGQIVFSNNAPSVPLLAGAQDRLSVMMQLGALLAGDPARYPPGSQIALQTVTARDADVWVFTVGEEEKITLPAGEIRAIRLTRPPRREFDLKVELWLSPGHNYLPARLVLTEPNGDFADFQMRELLPPSPPS